MQALRLIDRTTVPPKIHEGQDRSFSYFQSETDTLIQAGSFIELVAAVKAHRRANNLPIGLLIDQEIEEHIASRVPQNFTALSNGMPNIQVNRDAWPMWAKTLALLATPEDKGIGSLVERLIGPTNSQSFKDWYSKLFGRSCGCSDRRDLWNMQYPLNQ